MIHDLDEQMLTVLFFTIDIFIFDITSQSAVLVQINENIDGEE